MTQDERLEYLIKQLIDENEEYRDLEIPDETGERKRLFRSLMNVRPPRAFTKDFLQVQDSYLKEEAAQKGIVRLEELTPVRKGIYLWQGDITRLGTDAIVNAANCRMLGCFVPCHGCIDNAIHSAAGGELRQECAHIMAAQRVDEPTGRAKITGAYNLPCRYVIHTVGPIIYDKVTQKDCELLACCYRSCLELAGTYGLKSIAFCCISTGEFHFPNELAAQIAVRTVEEYQKEHTNQMEVVFNVFKDRDYEIYREILQ